MKNMKYTGNYGAVISTSHRIDLNTTAGKHPGSVVNRARDRVRTTGISAAIG